MTTFVERKRALVGARAWLEVAAASEDTDLATAALDALHAYPSSSQIEQQLIGLHGYRLLACLRSLERTARLLEWASRSSGRQYAETARCLLRHFPDRPDLEQALMTSQHAAAWTAFNLDRPPGRLAVLTPPVPPVPPALDDSKGSRTGEPTRRAALDALLPLLERLEADSTLEVAARLEALRLCTGPLRSGLESPLNVRYRTRAAIQSLNLWFTALQDACHLVQAIGEGWFRTDRKLRASAQRLGQGLPEAAGFPIAEIEMTHCQAWVDWIFCANPKSCINEDH